MDFLIENAIVLSAYASEKSDAVYLDVRTTDSTFNLTVRGVPVSELNKNLLDKVKISGHLLGRVYRNDSGIRQTLEAQNLKIVPLLPEAPVRKT